MFSTGNFIWNSIMPAFRPCGICRWQPIPHGWIICGRPVLTVLSAGISVLIPMLSSVRISVTFPSLPTATTQLLSVMTESQTTSRRSFPCYTISPSSDLFTRNSITSTTAWRTCQHMQKAIWKPLWRPRWRYRDIISYRNLSLP